MIDAEALQAEVEHLGNPRRRAVEDARRARFVIADAQPAFRRQHELVAAAFERLADQRLVVPDAVDRRGIEKVIAEVERAVEQPGTIGIARRRAVRMAQRHAAEADGLNVERAELTFAHAATLACAGVRAGLLKAIVPSSTLPKRSVTISSA